MVTLSEASQTEREEHHTTGQYMWHLEKRMLQVSLFTTQKGTRRLGEQARGFRSGKDWEGRGGADGQLGSSGWTRTQAVFKMCVNMTSCITRQNSAQPVRQPDGRRSGENGCAVYVWPRPSNCPPETATVWLISFIVQNYTFFKNDQRREGKGRGRITVGI